MKRARPLFALLMVTKMQTSSTVNTRMFVYGLIVEIVMLVVDETDLSCALCAEPLQVQMFSSLL